MRRTLVCLLAVGVLSLVGACGGDDGDTDAREADLITAMIPTADGEVTVSLNAHGQETDTPITIEAITRAEGDQPSEDFVAAFRLLPAGATFETPVTLSVVLPGEPRVSLTGIHESEGDANTELLSFLPVSYDPTAGATTYEAAVTHFSEVQLETWGHTVETRLLPDVPGDKYVVGDSFTMTVRAVPRVIPSRDGAIYSGRQTRVVSTHPDRMHFQANWKSTGGALDIDFNDVVTFAYLTRQENFSGSPLTPTEIDAVPAEQAVTDGQSLTFDQEFRCVSPGRFVVIFRGNLQQPGESTTFEGAKVVEKSAITRWAYATLAITGECVVPEASTTPTPGVALPTTGVASPTTGVAPAGTALATGEDAIPTVVLPPEIVVATPASAPGSGNDLPGFIRVYAYAGVFYYADTLVVTPAHEPFCSYEHLHGQPIPAVERNGLTLPPIAEMYGECGFGPTDALFWIPEPE